MKLSPDGSTLIFTDGVYGVVNIDTSDGNCIGSTYVGNSSIIDLYSAAISPDS